MRHSKKLLKLHKPETDAACELLQTENNDQKIFKIVMCSSDLQVAKDKLKKEVAEYFGDHVLLRK